MSRAAGADYEEPGAEPGAESAWRYLHGWFEVKQLKAPDFMSANIECFLLRMQATKRKDVRLGVSLLSVLEVEEAAPQATA